jgi:XTP/dITP diphosphohydrolase
MNLLVATGNAGKAREFREMLGSDRFAWTDLASLGRTVAAPEETGSTFRANACLKATYYARAAGTWTIADDSGLEVDALGGRPGVTSARWAELHDAGKGDAANNALLLNQLDAVPDDQRTARFVCVLALADPTGVVVLTARDVIEGRVLRAPRGANGFGYDPLFYVEQFGRTTAELSPDEKHAVSHRGNALRRLKGMMERPEFRLKGRDSGKGSAQDRHLLLNSPL